MHMGVCACVCVHGWLNMHAHGSVCMCVRAWVVEYSCTWERVCVS